MIRENKTEKNNVVNEQETIQNNIKCRYRRPTPKTLVYWLINCQYFIYIQHEAPYIDNLKET